MLIGPIGLYQPLEVETNRDATEFAFNTTNIGRNFTADILAGFQNRAGQYNISAKYCRPDGNNSTSQTIQFLTHGIGFDKTYWDLSYNNYNYRYAFSTHPAQTRANFVEATPMSQLTNTGFTLSPSTGSASATRLTASLSTRSRPRSRCRQSMLSRRC